MHRSGSDTELTHRNRLDMHLSFEDNGPTGFGKTVDISAYVHGWRREGSGK